MSLRFPVLLSLCLLLCPTAASAAGDARYEAALQKTFELTYLPKITGLNVDEAVDSFLQGIEKEESMKACPAAMEAMRAFGNHQFREAVSAYISSKEFRDIILEGMRKHYTQADLDAFIAFAATPAGASYVEHNALADAEVEHLIKERMEHLVDSPQIAKMLSELGAVLMVPMMKCQSK